MEHSLTFEDADTAAATAFKLLNRAFFDGKLPAPFFEVGNYVTSDGTPLCGIYLRPNEHPNYPHHTILVNPIGALQLVMLGVADTWQIAIVDTLLHELVHYYNALNDVTDCDDNGYHNEAFRDAAESHGLDCEWNDNGWAATGIGITGWLVIQGEITDSENAVLNLM